MLPESGLLPWKRLRSHEDKHGAPNILSPPSKAGKRQPRQTLSSWLAPEFWVEVGSAGDEIEGSRDGVGASLYTFLKEQERSQIKT